MTVYLPIAGLSLNIVTLLLLGGGIGFLSGLFGVGGGFLLTPLLIFLGVPSPVAVATGANQVVGASVSGVIAHWRRKNVDIKMGLMLVAGGLIGAVIGVWMFARLRTLGQVDLAINLCYVVFLGFVGGSMLIESLRALLLSRHPMLPHKRHRHLWAKLPLKMRFARSGLYISVLLPLSVGAIGGLLAALMGVGGGFIMVPLMIYILEIPTSVVIGTSLFQIIFVTATVTFLQAVQTQTVDVVLMLTLLIGGVIGAQLGARFGARLRAEQVRILLALLVLVVCGRLLYELAATPSDLYGLAGM
ncbi:sulfite exporter TauE/SafE family protein [Telmatospirillum sp.]|uniref:sulfite exporter TauE/SafE family protein n=1 Tax=Telmatospirillum sp. TaxID=2079197 RepID=UPI00285068CD|nr:sulfite exporter TauE/SafE family protein [Telmatospirillum sp.]MDR3440302.1 sulfite exporter TauE/SafE family protein [Telmatospirillum sp.]